MAKPIPEEKTSRRIGDLAMVWRHASQYPRQIAFAGLALMMTSAATIGIPYGFKRVIDRGFGPGAGGSVANSFHYLLMIVVVLALAIYALAHATASRRIGEDTRELASSVVQRISALHGLILALVFAQELYQYQEVRTGLVREATAVAVLLHQDGPLDIVDDNPAVWGTLHGLTPVIGSVDLVTQLVDHGVLLTLGKGRHRRRVAVRLGMLGLDASRYRSMIHPRVVLPGSCHIGVGSIALDGVVLTADVEVGDHVVLMPQVTLTHGCTVHDYATICAGVSRMPE